MTCRSPCPENSITMSQVRDIDVQAQEILTGLKTLGELLDQPVARDALDLNKNATTSDRYEVLRRLRQSLRQYLERDGDLFYVGLLGHFSTGKSSTINSLLGTWTSQHERTTGLNPTDTTITLITQEKNSNSLLGIIREGHVTIRYQAVDSPLLDDLVLVDTPGTGDPQLLQEIARDFLPICDVILFLLSPASSRPSGSTLAFRASQATSVHSNPLCHYSGRRASQRFFPAAHREEPRRSEEGAVLKRSYLKSERVVEAHGLYK